MIYKKFEQGDLLYNKINVYPKTRITIAKNRVFLKSANPTLQNLASNNSNIYLIPNSFMIVELPEAGWYNFSRPISSILYPSTL